MHGLNPLRPLRKHSGATLAVQDHFHTIQGEGPLAGTPATFIRLWGCHLHCHYCDTDFESNRHECSIDELVNFCAGGIGDLVILTGGEPMRQNIAPLIDLLHRRFNKRVQIETAGSFWFQQVPDSFDYTIVCSPKTPTVHEMIRLRAHAFKYIISADNGLGSDGLPIVNFQDRAPGARLRPLARPREAFPRECIYVQPMDEGNEHKNKANLDLCVQLSLKHGYRVSIQQHKLYGLP